MSEVDALVRKLTAAPPRSAEIVKRYALRDVSPAALGPLFEVEEPQARRLLLRALLDVSSGGTLAVSDADEATLLPQVLDAAPVVTPLAQELVVLVAKLRANSDEVTEALRKAAEAFEASPDRVRDEWLRRAAIVLVLALTAFFYWRDQNKPRPPPEKRPTVAPASSN